MVLVEERLTYGWYRRRGAVRKQGTKKGSVHGSAGDVRDSRARGRHRRRNTAGAPRSAGPPRRVRAEQKRATAKKAEEAPEIIAGRNPVVEALRADVLATALYASTSTPTTA